VGDKIAQQKYREPGEIVIETMFFTHRESSSTAKWFLRDQPQKIGELDYSVQIVVKSLLHRKTGVDKICVREKALRIKHDKNKPQHEIMIAIEHAFGEADILLL
jgi:hypothetical protein